MQRIKHLVRLWFLSLLRLFFPRQCPVCGCLLQEGEAGICLRCNMDMPRTGYHQLRDNPMERMLWGKMPLERATAYFFYRKGSDFRRIVHQMKYNGRQDLAETMGRLLAQELLPSGFFQGIDLLLPVPLHPAKERKRGYNQSERLAQGIAAVTAIPIDNSSVTRLADTETQTRKSAYERWENVEGIFRLLRPERFGEGQHILLIDDVFTTGATITACADAFQGIEGLHISVLTLCIAE